MDKDPGLEMRRLSNDRDYWKRKAAALERKYGRLEGHAFIALVAVKHGKKWDSEVLWFDDERENVQASRHMRRQMMILAEELKDDGYVPEEDQDGGKNGDRLPDKVPDRQDPEEQVRV